MKSLEELAGKLAYAKRKESEYKNKRIQIEEELAELVETPENGSRTVQAGDGLKVTVKRSMGYKADIDAIEQLDIPEDAKPLKVVPESKKFDEKKYEKIIKEHPALRSKLAKFVIVKPRKTSVTLKIG